MVVGGGSGRRSRKGGRQKRGRRKKKGEIKEKRGWQEGGKHGRRRLLFSTV